MQKYHFLGKKGCLGYNDQNFGRNLKSSQKSEWTTLIFTVILGIFMPPPLNGHNFQTFLYPIFFRLQLTPT